MKLLQLQPDHAHPNRSWYFTEWQQASFLQSFSFCAIWVCFKMVWYMFLAEPFFTRMAKLSNYLGTARFSTVDLDQILYSWFSAFVQTQIILFPHLWQIVTVGFPDSSLAIIRKSSFSLQFGHHLFIFYSYLVSDE